MRFQAVAVAAALFGSAAADCVMKNVLEDKDLETETDEKLCQKQDEGIATFSMSTNMIAVPTFDGDNALAGAVTHQGFMLYDHDCKPKAVYGRPKCGIPWVVKEDWLKYDLIIDNVNLATGGASYDFGYGAGEYMTHENSGSCEDASHGLTGEEHCQVPFPIEGGGERV